MSGRNGNNNCCKNDTDGGAATHAAAVKPDNNFIAGLKRLAKERRVANDAANKERVAADLLDDNYRDQLGGKAVRSNNPAKDQNGAVAKGKGGDANGTTGDNIPDMTGKVISVSTENQPLSSSSNNQPQSKQHRRRDDSNKQRQKKKNGTSGSHPKTKKKPTTISQLEDGLLPDMTGKEILVDQLELPSIEPVKEEVDLDDLILEEQSSTSTNKRITVGATSATTTAAAAGGTSKNLNRRGLLTRNRSVSQRSLLSSSTTSENSNGGGGGGGGGSRSQLFASYNDPSQRSLQTQTTSATSGKDSGGGDDSDLLPQQQQQHELPQTITRNLRPANSRRDRVSSLHSSYQYAPTTLGRIPSGGILPDGGILPEVDEEMFQSKITDAISKSMPPSRSISPSWASLIALDEHSKRASMEMECVGEEEERYYTSPSHRRKTTGLQTSWTSVKSEGSRNSHGSRESDSRRSKRSTGDGRSRQSNRSGSGSERRKASSENNWRNESTMSMLPTLSQMKDPEYIRSQAMERFERGLDYAEIGKLGAARERFLVALRYRVMDRGSLHPDVAATHEMLGHVEYFLGENKKNGSFEGNLVRLDEGDDGLLGGNLTIMENPDKDGQSSLSSRGKSHYEKAAMHYQTALDILDAKELDISNEKMSAWMNGGSAAKDETEFQWKELAETYTALDEKGRLGVEERIDIVARIQERMGELPVTVGEKSYATSFLSTFYE